MTDKPSWDIAQPREAMFERNIAHLAARMREVRLVVDSHPEPIVGFFAGLDESWVQVCHTQTQTLEMFDRAAIVSIGETGKALFNYQRDKSFDPHAATRIFDRIEFFSSKMKSAVERKRGEGWKENHRGEPKASQL